MNFLPENTYEEQKSYRKMAILITVFLLSLVIWKVGPSKLINVFKEAEIKFVVLVLTFATLRLLTKGYRSYKLFNAINKNLNLTNFLPVYFFCYSLTVASPPTLGEVGKVEVKRRLLKMKFGDVGAAIFIYRLLDCIAIGLMVIFFFLTAGKEYAAEWGLFTVAAAIAFAIWSFILLALLWERLGKAFFEKLAKFFSKLGKIGKKIAEKILNVVERYYRAIKQYIHLDRKPLITATFLTGIRWAIEILVLYFALLAFDVQASLKILIFAIGLSNFVGVSSGPGELGAGAVMAILVLAKIGGIGEVIATAGILLTVMTRLLIEILAVFLGSLFLSISKNNQKNEK
jgi:uncharacterized protein (TIRG00374 family)